MILGPEEARSVLCSEGERKPFLGQSKVHMIDQAFKGSRAMRKEVGDLV